MDTGIFLSLPQMLSNSFGCCCFFETRSHGVALAGLDSLCGSALSTEIHLLFSFHAGTDAVCHWIWPLFKIALLFYF